MLKRREIMDWRFESGGRHAKSIINPAGIFIISRVEDQKRLPCFLGLLSWNSFCSFLKGQKQIAVFVIFSRSGTAVEFNLMDHARQKASLRETPGVIVAFQYHYSFFYQFFFQLMLRASSWTRILVENQCPVQRPLPNSWTTSFDVSSSFIMGASDGSQPCQ
jgi:hypothetical protein